MEHLFDVAYDGNSFFPEVAKDSNQRVYQVWSSKQCIIRGNTTEFCGAIKHHPQLAWLLRVVNHMMWLVPCYFFLRQRRGISLVKHLLHEGLVTLIILLVALQLFL